jgi:hypothetical protein
LTPSLILSTALDTFSAIALGEKLNCLLLLLGARTGALTDIA